MASCPPPAPGFASEPAVKSARHKAGFTPVYPEKKDKLSSSSKKQPLSGNLCCCSVVYWIPLGYLIFATAALVYYCNLVHERQYSDAVAVYGLCLLLIFFAFISFIKSAFVHLCLWIHSFLTQLVLVVVLYITLVLYIDVELQEYPNGKWSNFWTAMCCYIIALVPFSLMQVWAVNVLHRKNNNSFFPSKNNV